jgi:hypothetical protein
MALLLHTSPSPASATSEEQATEILVYEGQCGGGLLVAATSPASGGASSLAPLQHRNSLPLVQSRLPPAPPFPSPSHHAGGTSTSHRSSPYATRSDVQGVLSFARCRACTPGTHARKDEDGLLLEFPWNRTRTCFV